MTVDANTTISISVETSGRVGSVAVARGEEIVAGRSFSTQRGHGVELLPTVSALCEQAGVAPSAVKHVYVSGGPGSFTGLRIGVTFAKAMALAVGARVVRVPTLDVIAQNALAIISRPSRVVAVLDAKRRHVYASAFDLAGEHYEPIDEPNERDPESYLQSLGPVTVLGEGIAYHQQAIEAVEGVTIGGEELSRARAETVHRLGRRMALSGLFISIGELIPIYVRRPEAEEKWDERHA
jgi:tRNA threonylcarbamoyladenosine biosynthesis protein TsaB